MRTDQRFEPVEEFRLPAPDHREKEQALFEAWRAYNQAETKGEKESLRAEFLKQAEGVDVNYLELRLRTFVKDVRQGRR
jgi:hypothetical protein